MKKIFIFIGTRPEAIKLAPLIHVMKNNHEFDLKVVSTGQHREMLHQMFDEFNVCPDFDLDVMAQSQTLTGLTSILFEKVGNLLRSYQPDMVIVQGDTATAMVAAVCSFYEGIPVSHVEAGLRSGDIWAPFPEEVSRKFISTVASLHFAPTQFAANNLIAEGVQAHKIFITGNTSIDSILWMKNKLDLSPTTLPKDIAWVVDERHKYVLITGHRRESFGDGFDGVCDAINTLSKKHPDIYFIYPLHLNPKVRMPVLSSLGGLSNVLITDPLNYSQFVQVMSNAHFLLTDSGGVQEEAPALRRPVLVMREVTERQEGILAGCAKLVGVNRNSIIKEVSELIINQSRYDSMSNAVNPYGDGKASQKIYGAIIDFLGMPKS